MRNRIAGLSLSAALLLSLPFCLRAQSAPKAKQPVLAIEHATVIDTHGGPSRANETVIIAGDRIVAEGPAGNTPVPHGAQTIDATGKFLIPGLWDMHVHLDYMDYLPLFIANGVTGVRVMWGEPKHRQWRKEIDGGELIGPRMVIGSAIIDGPKPYWPGSISVANEAEARQAVAQAKVDGAEFIKVYQFLPRDLYFAIADESKKQGIPFEGHLPLSVSPEEASAAGQKSIEHLTGMLAAVSTRSAALATAEHEDLEDDLGSRPRFWGSHMTALREEMLRTYSPEKAAAVSTVLRKNGTWQCPTLTLLHMFAYGDDPEFLHDTRLKYVPPHMRAYWDPAQADGGRTLADFSYMKREFQMDLALVGAMESGGVGILAGTDTQNPYSFYGFSLHDELGLLAQAGLSPMQALQTATLNPARFLGREQDFGSVEKGKFADLVLLDADPLATIGNTKKINAVIYRGQYFPRASLDRMLAQAEVFAARKLIGPVLLQTIQEKGIDAGVAQYREIKSMQAADYDLSENELVGLGYQLINQKKYKDAIEIFKLAVEAYPASYNTYDSLGEAYMDNGDRDLAIANYKKSLELNPRNINGIAMLKKLNAE